MAEKLHSADTRARSAERAPSRARARGTAAASPPERATSDITSQFNFFFAELRSAVKRPDSLTVGVAGPFDPIGIPDDVNATHAALALKPDSVSVKEIERCLKIVTDLSEKRKDDMLETITEAITAERDAHIQAKLAEHDEVMHALMRARDEENAAKIAELIKTIEGRIALTRPPVRSAGFNEGGETIGGGIAATGGAVALPQFQAGIGVDATISLQFFGDVVNSKEKAKLHSLSPEPS
jgi:hypothetical protein